MSEDALTEGDELFVTSSLSPGRWAGRAGLARLSHSGTASSAIGHWCQADPVGNNLSWEHVHLERDRLVAGRQKLDPVRTWRKRQRMGIAVERACDAYIVIIDIDKGVGWINDETDPAVLGFRWIGVRRDRNSVRRVPIVVVRVPLVH